MTIRDLARNVLDVTANSAQFLGFRPEVEAPIPYDIYSFLIKSIRDADRRHADLFLQRFLMGPQEDFERTYKTIRSILQNWSYTKCPEDLLQFLRHHVGFTDERRVDAVVIAVTSEIDQRRLIKSAIPVWKRKGSEQAYELIATTFGAKRIRIDNWFYYRMILTELGVFGEDLTETDPWLVSQPALGTSDPDEYITDIRIMDEGLSTVNRPAVKAYMELVRPTSERLNLIYVDYLDRFSDAALLGNLGQPEDMEVTGGEVVHKTPAVFPVRNVAVDTNSANWTDVHCMWKVKTNTTVKPYTTNNNEGRLLYYYTDTINHMFVKVVMVSVGRAEISLWQNLNGTESQFGSTVEVDFDEDTYYVFRVQTFKYEDPGSPGDFIMQHRILLDQNVVIEYQESILTSSFEQGNFGLESTENLLWTMDEMELYQWPLTIDRLWPELFIIPRGSSKNAGESVSFSAFGGRTPYTFSIAENESVTATIDPTTGAYVAGGTSGTDKIQVTDKNGTTAFAFVTVSGAPPAPCGPTINSGAINCGTINGGN